MRGKEIRISSADIYIRITPAYAGKRQTANWEQKTLWGSPPPMRGKALDRWTELEEYGITPAYAGKSVPVKRVV